MNIRLSFFFHRIEVQHQITTITNNNFELNFLNFLHLCSKHVPNEPAISKESVTSKTQQSNTFGVVRLISRVLVSLNGLYILI